MSTEQELNEFANALQLSIKTRIEGIREMDGKIMISIGGRPDPHDHNLLRSLHLFDGRYDEREKCLVIDDPSGINLPKRTLFLLLTRMNDDNIQKLAELDPSVSEFANKLGLKMSGNHIDNVERAAEGVFKKMEEKKMTMRELAGAAGLTQVTLSNFKAGGDIRLSNLIKIAKAVGLNVMLK